MNDNNKKVEYIDFTKIQPSNKKQAISDKIQKLKEQRRLERESKANNIPDGCQAGFQTELLAEFEKEIFEKEMPAFY